MNDRLEELELCAESYGLTVDYNTLEKSDILDGLCIEVEKRCIVLINKHRTVLEQTVALAEEIGHYLRTHGDIVRQETVTQRKGERYGREFSYQMLLPVGDVETAFEDGVRDLGELSERFGLPCEFVREAILHYQHHSMIEYVHAENGMARMC